MYKNVLIISDNLYLCNRFLEIIERKKIPNCLFTFSISPFSNKEDFKILDADIKVFDLKDQKHIDVIKNNYDLIFSIHCKQIFPFDLINHLKCLNVHPGFNPINKISSLVRINGIRVDFCIYSGAIWVVENLFMPVN